MSNINPTTAPSWAADAKADQDGWADAKTGEILVSLAPTTVDVNFLNATERAQALEWVQAGLLTPAEAGLTGAIAGVTMIDVGHSFTTPPTVAVVGVGSLGSLTAVLGTVGKVVSAVINVAGTGYAVGDELLLTDTGSHAKVVVDTIGGAGEVLTFTVIDGGKNYTANTVGVAGVSVYAAAIGVGATFDLTVGYPIDVINITVPGSGYIPDTTEITITGGTTAAAKALILDVGTGDFATMESLANSRM